MKSMFKKVFVLLVVAIVFVAAQPAGAETVTVSGTIDEISYRPSVVTVDGVDVHGVKVNYLCNQYNICLEEGETVSFVTYEYECTDGTTKLMATNIIVGEATITLR